MTDARFEKIVQAILNLGDPSEIPEELNNEDISADSSLAPKFAEKPGDVIDDQFVAFLIQNPEHYFKKSELVGFLGDDDIYILAKIIGEVSSVQPQSNFNQKYKIEVGGGKVKFATALNSNTNFPKLARRKIETSELLKIILICTD